MALGRDFSGNALARFSGRLYDATLTQQAPSAYNASNPTAAPTSMPVAHACEGIAFSYAARDIDGTRVMKHDYRVVILKGSLDATPAPGDTISIPPPGSSTPATARVIDVESVTEAAVTLHVRGPA
jgi:hypothetical protein